MGNPLAWLPSGSATRLRTMSIKLVFSFSMACCVVGLSARGNTALASTGVMRSRMPKVGR